MVWIAERRDVLSGLFFVLTLAAYLGYVRRGGVGRYLLVDAAVGLGADVQSRCSLPCRRCCCCWIIGRWVDSAMPADIPRGEPQIARRSFGRLVVEKFPLVALAAADALMTRGDPCRRIVRFHLADRLSSGIVAVASYLGQFFCPIDLAIFYPLPIGGQPAWKVAGSAVLVVGDQRRGGFGAAACALSAGRLVLVFGDADSGARAWCKLPTTRWPTVTCICPASDCRSPWLGRGPAWRHAGRRQGDGFARDRRGLAAVLVVLAARQTSLWQDGETLWNHAIAATRDNDEAQIGLAESLRAAGRPGRRDRALSSS